MLFQECPSTTLAVKRFGRQSPFQGVLVALEEFPLPCDERSVRLCRRPFVSVDCALEVLVIGDNSSLLLPSLQPSAQGRAETFGTPRRSSGISSQLPTTTRFFSTAAIRERGPSRPIQEADRSHVCLWVQLDLWLWYLHPVETTHQGPFLTA